MIEGSPPYLLLGASTLLYVLVLGKYIHYSMCVSTLYFPLCSWHGMLYCPHKCSREVCSSCIVQTLTSFGVSPALVNAGDKSNDILYMLYSHPGAGFRPALTQATCCHAFALWLAIGRLWIRSGQWCWSAIRCQFPLTHCIRNDLRGNADLKSALRNAWLVPGQGCTAIELPWGDSEGHRAPLTQQEKQSHFKSLWHLVPRPGIFIRRSFPTTAQLGRDAGYKLIGADRCISGHVSLLHALQAQVASIMTWTNDWAMNIVGLVVKPIREVCFWDSYIILLCIQFRIKCLKDHSDLWHFGPFIVV